MHIGYTYLIDLTRDRQKFMESLFFIQDKNRQLVRFKLNKVQQDFVNKRTSRNIILKARQLGFSTFILGDMLAEAITVPNTVCVCISHEERATQRLLKKVHMMYDMIPIAARQIPELSEMTENELRPKIHHQSAYEMTWPDIGSSFYIGTARAPSFGRGDTIHRLHMSELAHYPTDTADKLMAAVSQSVPKGSMISIESNPKGRGGVFYSTYQMAKEGLEYKPFFYPWWWSPEYTLEDGSELALPADRYIFDYTDDEQALVSAHNLTRDQIRWRRHKKSELELLYHQDFAQEYPENDIDCWLVGGQPVFNTKAIKAMLTYTKNPLLDVGGEPSLRIWQLPRGDTKYLICVDPAEGLPTSDYSVAVVLDLRYNVHVATLRARMPIDHFTNKLSDLGNKYNTALIVVERNNHGHTVIDGLKRIGYTRLYEHEDKKIGWLTTLRNRTLMIDLLGINLSSMSLTSYDENFLDEAISFQFQDGKAQAPPDGHDDLVMAMAIGQCVRNKTPISNRPPSPPVRYAEEVL